MKFYNIEEKDLKFWDNVEENKLVKEITIKKYLSIYNMYRMLFTEYIINNYNLKQYDNEIKNSTLNFKTISKKKMDTYQYFSCDELKYFYLRNNIYISKLNAEEKNFLEKIVSTSNYEFSKETEKFIRNTYKKVIYEGDTKKDLGKIVMYGPNGKNFMSPNNSLIIGLRYDKFNLNGLNEKEWEELYLNQLDFLNNLLPKMNKKLNKISSEPVKVIQYNDFSTLPRN